MIAKLFCIHWEKRFLMITGNKLAKGIFKKPIWETPFRSEQPRATLHGWKGCKGFLSGSAFACVTTSHTIIKPEQRRLGCCWDEMPFLFPLGRFCPTILTSVPALVQRQKLLSSSRLQDSSWHQILQSEAVEKYPPVKQFLPAPRGLAYHLPRTPWLNTNRIKQNGVHSK